MTNKEKKHNYYGAARKNQSFFVRFLFSLVGFLARILYRPTYHNLHYIPRDTHYMLLGNHISLLDPVVLHLIIPDYVHWVAKEEFFKNKVLAFLFDQLKVVSLNRDRVDIQAMRKIKSHIQNEEIVGIFPQGTRVDPIDYEEILPQAGVASICMKYDCTILPFYVDAPFKLFRKSHIYFGAPFCLNSSLKIDSKKEKRQLLANEIMRRSYSLVDKTYL